MTINDQITKSEAIKTPPKGANNSSMVFTPEIEDRMRKIANFLIDKINPYPFLQQLY